MDHLNSKIVESDEMEGVKEVSNSVMKLSVPSIWTNIWLDSQEIYEPIHNETDDNTMLEDSSPQADDEEMIGEEENQQGLFSLDMIISINLTFKMTFEPFSSLNSHQQYDDQPSLHSAKA